jgi:hypothetical protein
MGNKLSSTHTEISYLEDKFKRKEDDHPTSINTKQEDILEFIEEKKSDCILPIKYDKEIQCQPILEINIPNKPVIARIYIALPNYIYKWDGILEKAPHVIYKISEIDWAKRMENSLIEQRKTCKWVKENNRIREFNIQKARDNRSWHIEPHNRELDLKKPCNGGGIKEMFGGQKVRCPGNDEKFQELINRQKLNNKPNFDGFLMNTKGCSSYCYYKHIIDIEIHNLSCKLCSEPIKISV